jgi:hypothetical protein
MTSSPSVRRRFHEYQDLMRHRIMDILLVSTPYDTFILEEAGELSERMLGEFRNLDLHYAPGLTGVSTGTEASTSWKRRASLSSDSYLADMNAASWRRGPRGSTFRRARLGHAELSDFQRGAPPRSTDFLWQGERMLVAS